jgi:hypothetical protein
MNQQVHGARRRVHILLLLVCLALLASSGCSTTKWLSAKITPSSSGLKKRVYVLSFWDQARLGEKKTEQLTDQFLSLLNKDGAFVVEWSRKYTTASDKARAPQFGIAADPEEAKRASELGMNVMLTGVFCPSDTQ